MKVFIRVDKIDDSVDLLPIAPSLVYVDALGRFCIDKCQVLRLYYPEYRSSDVRISFDWSDEVDYFGHPLKEPEVSFHHEHDLPRLK